MTRGVTRLAGASRRAREIRSRIRIVWLVIGAVLAVSNAVGATPMESSPLDRLHKNWRDRASLIAHFEQLQHFTGFDEPLESRGTLRILRPSYFEIAFDPPNRQRQVCDGAFVWTYVPEQKQVVKAALSPEATRSADLLDWALEGATLISSTSDPTMGAGGVRLDVKPGPQLPLQTLIVWMRDADGTLLGYEATDTEGNRTRMRILDLKPAKGLKPSDFAFTPPPGVEIVDMGEGR